MNSEVSSGLNDTEDDKTGDGKVWDTLVDTTAEDRQMFNEFFEIINSDFSISYLPMELAIGIPSVTIMAGEMEIVVICHNQHITIINWLTFTELLEKNNEEAFSSHLFLRSDTIEGAAKTLNSLIRIVHRYTALKYDY